jgi:hypothetical protein
LGKDLTEAVRKLTQIRNDGYSIPNFSSL